MIYFDYETQEELIVKMVPLLTPEGCPIIGHAESLSGLKHPLKMVSPLIYRKQSRMAQGTIRVIIVDDSPTIQKVLKNTFDTDPEIEVVGTAVDPYDARDKIRHPNPDVISLDLELPKMDGLTFLRIIMKQRPMPVIIFSLLFNRGTATAPETLRSDAFDVFGKLSSPEALKDIQEMLCMKIKEAGWARRNNTWQHRVECNKTASPFSLQQGKQTMRLQWENPANIQPQHLLAIGASTGGTEAVSKMLRKLPPQVPPILVAQHIPASFSNSFALRLEAECAVSAKDAEDGGIARAGCICVAPGGKHLTARWNGVHYRLELNEDPPLWHQRPAVDVLFKSITTTAGPHIVAVLLTGMGRDGTEGLKALSDAGDRCFAQDGASCEVYGMPKAAHDTGAPEAMIPLMEMERTAMQAFEDNF